MYNVEIDRNETRRNKQIYVKLIKKYVWKSLCDIQSPHQLALHWTSWQ